MSGKSLIVYYSWTGNTEVVAKEIKIETGFDIQAIEEQKERKKGSMLKPAMGALLSLKSRIKPMDFALQDYNQIILGLQVWAGHTTPPINTYLQKANLNGKKVFIFITKADDKIPQDIISSVTERIEKKGGTVVDSISFTTTIKTVITPEKFKDDLHIWLSKNQLIK